MLVETRPGGAPRPPVLGTIEEDDSVRPIAALVAACLGAAHPMLRILECGEDDAGHATDVLVIVEPVAGPAPAGAAWVAPDDPRLAGLRDDPATGPGIGRWLDELATGDIDPRRQRWEHPGFDARARAWMVHQLTAAGTPVLADPTVEQLWAISAMLRAETAAGPAFMKACARVFDIEPAATAALQRVVPGAVPEVIATDAGEGWLLMRDAGGVLVGEQPVEAWAASLGALAAVQQATADGLDGIELEDRGPVAVAAMLPELLDGAFVAGFPDDIGPRFRAAAPRLVDACAALDALGPGPTVIHGDFHPWNVLQAGERIVIIDWSDVALGHPFTDLATWFNRVADPAARPGMLDAWLGSWAGAAPRAALDEAAPRAAGRLAAPGRELPPDHRLARTGLRRGARRRRGVVCPVGPRLARRRTRRSGAPPSLRRRRESAGLGDWRPVHCGPD